MLRINCLSGSAQLFHTAQDHLPMDGAAHGGLGPALSINNQNIPQPQACPQANLVGTFSQLKLCQVHTRVYVCSVV